MSKIIRVLHVVTKMDPAGIENLIMTLYRKLDRSTIQFDFLVHREEKGFFEDEIILLGGVIHRVSSFSSLNRILYKKQIESIFLKNEYKIVHSHINTFSHIVLNIARKNGTEKLIAHSHTSKQKLNMKGLIKRFDRLFMSNEDYIKIACSSEASNWLFKNNKQCMIIPNAIDINRFKFSDCTRTYIREKLQIQNKTVFIQIGRFSKEKNYYKSINVFYDFCLENKENSVLLILGSGPLELKIKRHINDLGLNKNVIFLNTKKNVEDYLMASDIMIFPSLFEGLGIVAIEAQATGLPVVLSENLPKELNQTDLLFRMSLDKGDQEWSYYIKTILNSVNIKKRVDYSHELLNSDFSIDVILNKYLSIYSLNNE